MKVIDDTNMPELPDADFLSEYLKKKTLEQFAEEYGYEVSDLINYRVRRWDARKHGLYERWTKITGMILNKPEKIIKKKEPRIISKNEIPRGYIY